MLLNELDYELPPESIAQEPVEPRDAARLLVVRGCGSGLGDSDGGPAASGPRVAGAPEAALDDRRVHDLAALLRPGDLLVRNDTRVLAARTFFRRPTGGRLELLFLHRRCGEDATAQDRGEGPAGERWEVLVRGRTRPGEVLTCDSDETWTVAAVAALGEGRWEVEHRSAEPVEDALERCGVTPLPPYIHRPVEDGERYQTTFAVRPGSAAAPTAGLHFTPALDDALRAAGVTILEITLHVGLGTFRPLSQEALDAGRLHAEAFAVPADVWEQVRTARQSGRRTVAVGTTVVRTLEHLWRRTGGGPVTTAAAEGWTELFIGPGFRFNVVGALMTNFHLPRSSLLALVMAFCGVERTRAAYAHAVAAGYRFYSFGDAMLALP